MKKQILNNNKNPLKKGHNSRNDTEMCLDTSAGKALAVKSKESKYTLLFDASWTEWMMRCFKLSPRPPSKIAASTALPNLVMPRGSRVRFETCLEISLQLTQKTSNKFKDRQDQIISSTLYTKQQVTAGALRIFCQDTCLQSRFHSLW